MSSINDLPTLLHQYRARYRHALQAKIGIVVVLGGGILALLAWHLCLWHVPVVWRVGLPTIGAFLWLAALLWWIQHHWMSERATAEHIDHSLGLQQRLTTAAEFANAPQTPALYALLVDDMRQRWSANDLHVPRPVDRVTIAMAVILLLLLLWPHAGKTALQLAQLPHPFTPPPSPQATPPPPQDQQHQQRGGSSQQSSPSNAGQSQQPSSSSAGQSSSAASHNGASQQQPSPTGQSGDSQQGSNRSSSPPPPSQQNQSPQQNSTGQQNQTGQASPNQGSHPDRASQSSSGTSHDNAAQQPSQQGQSSQHQPSGQSGKQNPSDTAQQANAPSTAQNGKQGTSSTPQSAGQQGQSQSAQSAANRQSASTKNGSARSNAEGGQQGAQSAAMAQQQSGSGAGQSSIGQDALKADIQQLLKEVSGELKQLQEQMGASQHQPQIGKGTDPNLYDGSAPPVDTSTGTALPMQLQTDQAATKTPRPGSGVGQPSGEVSRATPQARAEAAQLSDQPLEETPTSREAVPPEYRPIFDRLHQQATQPSQTKQ